MHSWATPGPMISDSRRCRPRRCPCAFRSPCACVASTARRRRCRSRATSSPGRCPGAPSPRRSPACSDGVTMMMSRLEIRDQLDLLFGLAAADIGMTVSAELLRAIVRAEAAGEKAVAVAIWTCRRRGRRPRGSNAPSRSPRCRCPSPYSRRPSACPSCPTTRGCATTCSLRHREHAERIVVAQVLLGREREIREIGEDLQVVGMHAGRVELAPIVRRHYRRRARATIAGARAAARRVRRGWPSRSARAAAGCVSRCLLSCSVCWSREALRWRPSMPMRSIKRNRRESPCL